MTSINRFLEGLTLEAFFKPLSFTAFEPLFTGPLALLLSQYPYVYARLTLNKLAFATSRYFIIILVALFVLGIIRKLNSTLSRMSLNNFVTAKKWDTRKEIIVVTGGSSGIGAAVVQRFAEQGSKTIIIDINPPQTSASSSGLVYFYKADLASRDAITAVSSQIRKDHGNPTVLVNNAGIGSTKTILAEGEVERRRIFDVNILAHFSLIKEFLPSMIADDHGHVVTIASMASFYGHANIVSYTCTKAAALAFHEGLGQELRDRFGAKRVRTTIVHPAYVRTPIIERYLKHPKFNAFVLEPGTVADAIVAQVLSGYGAQLILPGRYSPVSILRGLPSWIPTLSMLLDNEVFQD